MRCQAHARALLINYIKLDKYIYMYYFKSSNATVDYESTCILKLLEIIRTLFSDLDQRY